MLVYYNCLQRMFIALYLKRLSLSFLILYSNKLVFIFYYKLYGLNKNTVLYRLKYSNSNNDELCTKMYDTKNCVF